MGAELDFSRGPPQNAVAGDYCSTKAFSKGSSLPQDMVALPQTAAELSKTISTEELCIYSPSETVYKGQLKIN